MNDPLDFSALVAEHMSAAQQPRLSVNLRFWTDAVPDPVASKEAGTPKFKSIDMVTINVPGSRDEVSKRVESMHAEYRPYYDRWRATQEQPLDGWPIDKVPFLHISQVREFQAANILTLEAFCSLSDGNLDKLGAGMRTLQNQAKTFMALARDTQHATSLAAENDALKQRVLDLEAEVKQIAVMAQQQKNEVLANGSGDIAVTLAAMQAQIATLQKGHVNG